MAIIDDIIAEKHMVFSMTKPRARASKTNKTCYRKFRSRYRKKRKGFLGSRPSELSTRVDLDLSNMTTTGMRLCQLTKTSHISPGYKVSIY